MPVLRYRSFWPARCALECQKPRMHTLCCSCKHCKRCGLGNAFCLGIGTPWKYALWCCQKKILKWMLTMPTEQNSAEAAAHSHTWEGSLLSGQVRSFDLKHWFSKGIKKAPHSPGSLSVHRKWSVKFAGTSTRNLLGIAPQSLSRAELDKPTHTQILQPKWGRKANHEWQVWFTFTPWVISL